MRFLSNLFLILLLIFSTSVFAQTKDFTIKVAGGADITPPTTPVLDSVVPVAESQIDISWQAATDDLMLSGYVLFRDGVPLATTTLTSYSDTGLVASTTYTYYVQAFDFSSNYSSSSNSIATTTLASSLTPAEASSNGSTQSTAVRATLRDFSIKASYTSALFDIFTSRPARIQLRWGRTTSYELGYVVNDKFLPNHQTNITGLEPGTTYEYELIGYSPREVESVLKRGQFKTLTTSNTTDVVNVNRFKVSAVGDDVQLTWELPAIDNLAYVRIVRSYFNFPTTIQNGSVVYQGLNEGLVDKNILNKYSPAFYTAFVVDTDGNVSSGAVGVAYAAKAQAGSGSGGSPIDVTPIEIFDPNAIFGDPDKTENSKDFRIPNLTDIYIIQNNSEVTFAADLIQLSASDSFKVRIPKATVSNNLKSIIISVTDPSDTREQYSYLLKINSDQTAYESLIPAMGVVGSSWALLDIYDYEAKVVSSYRKKMSFIQGEKIGQRVIFPDIFLAHPKVTLLLLLGFLLWILLLLRRDKRIEDKA